MAAAKHLLLIDDNEDILFMLKAMFQFKGYKVTVKADAEALENFILQVQPDIILMDMLLSGANGCELCKQIKLNPAIAHIPVVMMSAMPNAAITCKEAGAAHFIEKPFEMDSMLNLVAAAINTG
jgi:CheY-like chemotaxis protein